MDKEWTKREKTKTLTFLALLAILKQYCSVMLSKINRLRKKKDFQRAYQQGRSFSAPELWMKIFPNHLGINRVGIVVSRKISRKAVQRNLIKRRLRNLVRHYLPSLPSGYDIVFTARPGVLEKSYLSLQKTVEGLFRRSQLLK